MPMLFGYRAHRHFGLGRNEPRSGKQMQADPGYATRLHHIKMEAERTPDLERLIVKAQNQGWHLHQIVDAIEADKEGIVAEIRRRKAALDRSRA